MSSIMKFEESSTFIGIRARELNTKSQSQNRSALTSSRVPCATISVTAFRSILRGEQEVLTSVSARLAAATRHAFLHNDARYGQIKGKCSEALLTNNTMFLPHHEFYALEHKRTKTHHHGAKLQLLFFDPVCASQEHVGMS